MGGAAQASGGGYQLPVFPYRRPAELDGERKRYRVVVVGGGLSGLTAACDLASRGVPVVLLDEDDTVGVRGASSRGIVYAQKTLEIFDRLGIYPRIAEKGVTWSVGRVLADDDMLYRFDAARGSLSKQPPFINLQQFYIEWFLVDRLAELPAAELRWRNRVTGIELRADHVALAVETPEGSYALEADWVIDASGLQSLIRSTLGAEMAAELGEDRWCISDVRFEKELPAERWTWAKAAFNDGRAVWQHPMADGVWRLDYQMGPHADPRMIADPATVRDRLRRHLGECEVEIVWVGPYGYRTQLMKHFRQDRVFFIGDVAHVMNPFGARGGNSGVQDAENIAWKLAAVLSDAAPEALLDSYDEERRAAGAHNIHVTTRTIRFLAPRSPFEHRFRDAVLDLARRYDFARALVNTGRLSVPFDYAASRLTTNGGAAMPNLPVTLPDGTHGALSDLLCGPGAPFLVLCFPGAAPPDLSAGSARAYACGEPIGPLPVIRGEALRQIGKPGEVLVIRPDQHLAARLLRPEGAALAAALNKALGKEIPR
ncbi:MAG TPA: FAD-dependent oxidoreductase [Stellaceae bacterium]|nr:FAD-dependent oxidoreductase [Stellaceae bacterium]